MLFSKTKFSKIEISKRNLIYFVIIFLTTSISFYGLLYVLREAARMIAFISNESAQCIQAPILSPLEVSLYKFITALISTTYGLNNALHFLFNKPRKIGELTIRARLSILNDQRIMIYLFLFWFFSLAMVFLALMAMFESELSDLGLQETIIIVLFLCCLVLLFRSMLSLKRFIKQLKSRHIIISGLSIMLFSLLLSMIDFVRYNKLNEIIRQNLIIQYDIQLPGSLHVNKPQRRLLRFNLLIAFDEANEEKIYYYKHCNDYIELNDKNFREVIQSEKMNTRSCDSMFIYCNLLADKETPIRSIQKTLSELKNNNIWYVTFCVIPYDNIMHQRCYDLALNYLNFALELPSDFTNEQTWTLDSFDIKLFFHRDKTITYNEKAYDLFSFYHVYRELYFENPHRWFLCVLDKNLPYGDFIYFYSALIKITHDARNLSALSLWGMNYNQLFVERAEEIRSLFPFRTFFHMDKE